MGLDAAADGGEDEERAVRDVQRNQDALGLERLAGIRREDELEFVAGHKPERGDRLRDDVRDLGGFGESEILRAPSGLDLHFDGVVVWTHFLSP